MKQEQSNQKSESGIVAFSIQHPHFIIVACLISIVLGTLSLVLLPKDLLPSANMPAVQILSFYPGMPVDHVEQDLTFPFERYTGQAVGVQSQESRSLMGMSIVKNFFNSSIDLSSAIAQTGSFATSVMRKLPPGTQPPLILPFDPMASVPLAMVSVAGENKSESQIADIARFWVTNGIQGVTGAMAPAVMGGKTRQAIVYLDEKKMQEYNFSPVQVMNRLNTMNTFIPAGDIKIDKTDYQIVSNGLVTNLDDMDNFLLRAENGVRVPLKMVGHAEDSHAIQTNIVEIDGKPQAYVPVYRQPGANSLLIVDQVGEAMKNLEKTLDGFKLSIVGDQSIFIRKAIESITHEALIGGGFAALMVLLFLGSWRATFAVLLSLPLSLVGAFAALKMTGETLNVMTLGGLALSVGVLVDNAIVVIEVIMQKMSLGHSPRQASLIGGQEVAMPVLASTVSTLIVFFPIVFLGGVVKVLLAALSVAVIAAMAASYFAAMTVIPLFTTYFLKQEKPKEKGQKKGFLDKIQDGIESVTNGYINTLTWVLKKPKMILSVSVVVLMATAAIFAPMIGSELFPRADAGSFRIDLRGPAGLRVEETNKLSEGIQGELRKWIDPKDLKMIISNVGIYYGYSAAFTPNAGSQDFFLNVELTEDREHSSQYYAKIIREKLPKEFPQVHFGIELGGLLSSAINQGLVSPIDVQVTGPQNEKSHAIAESVLPAIEKIRGAVDVRIQQGLDSPQINLNIDRSKVRDLGLTSDDVIKNVVSGVVNSATYSQAMWIDPKTGIDYLLGVQFPETKMNSMEDLLNIPITGTNQKRSVPLGNIATTTKSQGPTEINHKNLQPVIDIYLDAEGRDIASVAKEVQNILDKATFPKGYSAAIRGEVSEMNEAIKSLGGGFLLAALLVYLILVVQFKSFLLPGIIMTTVPMGMVGIIVILALTKTYFSIQAAIGGIFVIGVAVSHGVLLVEYILEVTRHEADLKTAILTAARARLRPITMTSLASILGLLPMALGMGQGSEANIPLGRAVIGGQILATLLNFYLVPALFLLLYRFTKSEDRIEQHAP